MKCEYCGTEDQQGKTCSRCGARLPEPKKEIWKSEPFFYNGYICYALRDAMMDVLEVQFWLGRELIERIAVTQAVLDAHVERMTDPMFFFWDLFLIAHGEKEVLIWQEKNNKYPASFELRRIENPEIGRIRALTMQDLALESVIRRR